MKKIALAMTIVALALATSLGAGDRVTICHFDVDDTGLGEIIEVNSNSVDRHVANHGDLLEGQYDDLGEGACAVPVI